MIRLGHILYSNCYPVHARLLEEGPPADVSVVPGVPAELNAALAEGRIDVAPCSSIEFARHAGRYRILDGFAIASDGPVASILLESGRSPDELDGADVAVPTASATSVVLLRILLERRWGVRPVLRWYDQATADDPLPAGAAAALRIGDIALRREPPPGRRVIDLGAAWTEWTGLPFVFAVWQTTLGADRDEELNRLRERLCDSREWFGRHLDSLAVRRAPTFGLSPARLANYWRSLRYTLDPRATDGLLQFFSLATELGEAPPTPALNRV